MIYSEDPLLQARKFHVRKYQGSADGFCCVQCEAADPDTHVRFPCPVVSDNQCEFTFEDDWRCIQTKHQGSRHLVESFGGQRMVVCPEEEVA